MSLVVRWLPLQEVDAATLVAWTRIGQAMSRPNPFAMPQFVLPAAHWLTPRAPPLVALVERQSPGGRELVGVGCFTEERPNLFVPVPHLGSYRTLHTFRSGVLYAPGQAQSVAEALLGDLQGRRKRRHAIGFHNLLADCPVLEAMRELLEGGNGGWFEQHRFQRPVLRVHSSTRQTTEQTVGLIVMDRDLRRRKRRLEDRGTTSFRIAQSNAEAATADVAEAMETHLLLEHAGWKGTAGSSLLASPAQAGFFREMVRRFDEIQAAVFAETLCDGKVIASTSNLLLGDTLNGFKTGWHPDFAPCSPGRLNEVFLSAAVPSAWPQVDVFDSQAQQDSYLADLLPHRDTMVTGTLAVTRLGRRAMRTARLIRPVAYRLDRKH
ncbi:MAG: GNAT family N-acetyltransferase [Pseudoxanthomonas sp.]